MTDDFTLDPARTYNPKKPVVTQPAAKTEAPLDLAAIDINNPDELRKLAKCELLYVIQANRGSLGVVSALRELLDRIDGKPAQAVTVDQTVKHITVKATIRFAEMPVRVDDWNGGVIGGTLPPIIIDNNDKSKS